MSAGPLDSTGFCNGACCTGACSTNYDTFSEFSVCCATSDLFLSWLSGVN